MPSKTGHAVYARAVLKFKLNRIQNKLKYQVLNTKLIAPLFIAISTVAICSLTCEQPKPVRSFDYGTQSDSALYYYNQGWRQIMDNGQWTLSENSFRKAIEFDTGFLLGKSLVGRISTDLNERSTIYRELGTGKTKAKDYERLLLDAYLSSINIMNIREQESELKPELISKHRTLSETNFSKVIQKFPEATYVKAEYIEVLHALYGAKPALDSLHKLVTENEQDIPFFINYAASLEAELGNFENALLIANRLSEILNDTTLPEPYMLFAKIYFEMDSIDNAKPYIEKAVELDPKHLIAQGLKKRIFKQ